MAPDLLVRLDRSRLAMLSSLSRPLTLPQVASEAFLSPFHYHRLFTRVYGQTPLELLTRARLEKAKGLLLMSDLSVSEVCLAVGYQSLGTFSHRFRQATGCSPTEFREQARRFFELGRIWTHKFVPHCFVLRA